jgi:sialidase-1
LRRGGGDARRSRQGGGRARLSFDILEDRRMMSVTTPIETTYRDLVSVSVVGRGLFYNNSAYDGHDAAANAADSGAIATDKQALLPGGTASFANYTSYASGINGVLIDIAGLPSSTLSASDFGFRVGNSNDPSTWTAGPAPASISVMPGAGVSGSTRVELIWADGIIQKEWLQVTVNATPNTGLTAPDQFYFGNAIGETGDNPSDAVVDAIDQQGAHDHPFSAPPAPITNVYDFNRDGVVDASDESIAQANVTTAATALRLIAVPEATPTPAPDRLQTSLFNWGMAGYPVFNNPAIVTTNSGVVLAFAEGRATSQDVSSYAIVMRRSTDNGATWSAPTQVYGVAPNSGTVISQPSPIVDKVTGHVFLLFNRGQPNATTGLLELDDILVTDTSDDGLTWSTPVDITSSVTVTAANNPGPPGAFPNIAWGWAVVGPGHGIQLEHGEHAGRLIIGGDHRETADNSGKSFSHVIYSDDDGATWHLGGGLAGYPPPFENVDNQNDWSNENTLVEQTDGSIYMSVRVQKDQQHYRGASVSTDGGITWSPMTHANDLFVYEVEGSLIRLNDHVLLFSSPASTDAFDEVRHEMTIWASYDDGDSWVKKKVVFFGYSGYSDMTVVGPDTILLTFTRGWLGGLGVGDNNAMGYEFYSEIALVRINLDWLDSTDPYQFEWFFNEGAAGTRADSAGASIQDYGDWDQRAWARASNQDLAAQYVAGAGSDTALHVSPVVGSNGVVLSLAYDTALQAGPNDSFTVELELKTTDDTGVIIGTRPTIRNWTLQVVNGKLQFSLFDTVNTAVITSTAAINDGQWHHIAAVRDATGRLLSLYIDNVQAADPVVDTATKPIGTFEHVPVDAVYLGNYNTLLPSSKLDVTVDTLRFTRAALAPSAFLADDFVPPAPPPAPTYLPNAPTSLPGLQLWLPAYDPSRYFADFGSFANPLPLVPYDGMPTRSMNDASPNAFRVQTVNQYRQVLYAYDPVVGSYWVHDAEPNAQAGSEWQVHNLTTSLSPKRFDFVQNTGVFTFSTFVKLGASTGGYMTIFDTNDASTANPGFSLFVQQNGVLFLSVTGGTADTVRFQESAPGGAMTPGQWYHIAVVGNGPGNPVQFYVTPASDTNVTSYSSTSVLAGDNGAYTTDLFHELFIAGRSNGGGAPFNGGLVNEEIFDQALTPSQIQQLLLFGKGLTSAAPPWQNPAPDMAADIDGNGRIQATDALVIINRLLHNQGGTLPNPGPGNSPPPFVDPNGDGKLNAQDALVVINWLLHHPPQAGPAAAPLAEAGGPSTAIPLADPLAADALPADSASIASAIQFGNAPANGAAPTAESEPAVTAAPTLPAAAPAASILMVQPQYQRSANTANADAADEFFGNVDGTADDAIAPDALVTDLAIRRSLRSPRKQPQATA